MCPQCWELAKSYPGQMGYTKDPHAATGLDGSATWWMQETLPASVSQEA